MIIIIVKLIKADVSEDDGDVSELFKKKSKVNIKVKKLKF